MLSRQRSGLTGHTLFLAVRHTDSQHHPAHMAHHRLTMVNTVRDTHTHISQAGMLEHMRRNIGNYHRRQKIEEKLKGMGMFLIHRAHPVLLNANKSLPHRHFLINLAFDCMRDDDNTCHSVTVVL